MWRRRRQLQGGRYGRRRWNIQLELLGKRLHCSELSCTQGGGAHGCHRRVALSGGSVLGSAIYGRMHALQLGSNDDHGSGRMIRTTSVERYAATLAKWHGIAAADIADLFPTIGRCASADLGFLAS